MSEQHERISKDEHLYRVEVLTTLAKIVQRLDVLNGSVARHEKAIGEMSLAQAKEDGENEKADKLFEKFKPIIWSIASVLLAEILRDGPTLVKFIGGGGGH
jgi:hypothetical protein